MKNKIISITILIVLILPLLSFYNVVQAYSGEIDPKDYITMPSGINVSNETGTGTISLASGASGYTISYQKIDITKATFDSLSTKKTESEYYALIPNYTSSWKTTTNTTNNVKLDFKNYTGTAYFVLWAKIENGTNTYYDVEMYSSEIQKVQQQTTDDEKTSEDWTDFSNAKYELKKSGKSSAVVEISEVNYKERSSYYLYITSSSNKPDITSLDSSEKIGLVKEKNKLVSAETSKVAGKVELNQDLYATVVESDSNNKQSIVAYGNKLTRFEEPQYSDAFVGTYMANEKSQIVTNFTHSKENNRKIQIKVGKITDISILKKIKNQDSAGFSELLKFAKSSSGIYDNTLNADTDELSVGYNVGTGKIEEKSVIDLKGLQNDEYYYLYVKTDDENGKYISNEAVTLAYTIVYDGKYGSIWGLYTYGSSDFKWVDFGNITEVENDDSIAPVELPHAGLKNILWIGIIAITGAIVLYKKSNKYKGI